MLQPSLTIDHTDLYQGFFYYSTQLQLFDALGDMFVDMARADTAEKKFMLTRTLLAKYGLLPKVLVKNRHNSIISKDIRDCGNNCFKANKYYAAITKYTDSLLNSKPGSECWAYALANRSAALFHTKYYHSCLKDVDRALKSKYPARLKYKLYKRAGHAEQLLGRGDLAIRNYNECLKHLDQASMSDVQKNSFRVEITKVIEMCQSLKTAPKTAETESRKNTTVDEVLLGGKNECIPALSNCVELKYSANMGRGVYATCYINPGDVVAIEEPYICGSFAGSNNICGHSSCLKMSVAVIPCPKCLLTVYCDEECMQKAYEEHYIVCPIICSISRMPGDRNINELLMKWFLKECSQMGLKKFCSVVDQLSKTKPDASKRGFDENGLYKSDNFFTAYTLDVGENKLSMDVLFFFNCICAEMLQYLMLSGFDIPKCYLATVGASLVHMLIILDFNCLKLNLYGPAISRSPNHSLFLTTGLTLYPSIGLFNHSCDANITRSGCMSDKKRVLRAVQPIPKGTQLFISYGITYKICDRESRKQFCWDLFKNNCYCQPCLENWPTERYFPNRLSLQNILNPDKASMLSLECDKFIEFKSTVRPEDHHQHLNYLYSFLKLLFDNVKRPFALYEECVLMITSALITINDEETHVAHCFYNEIS